MWVEDWNSKHCFVSPEGKEGKERCHQTGGLRGRGQWDGGFKCEYSSNGSKWTKFFELKKQKLSNWLKSKTQLWYIQETHLI